MKNLKRIITTAIFVFAISALSAQTPPPPNNNGGGTSNPPNGNNIPVGGGAPIGSGVAILLTLGLAYGGKKIYDLSPRRKVGHEKETGELIR